MMMMMMMRRRRRGEEEDVDDFFTMHVYSGKESPLIQLGDDGGSMPMLMKMI